MPIIQLRSSKLHYRVMGHGPKALLAFHGYGQESHYYDTMARVLHPDYTVFAVDLFFHGKSTLSKADQPLSKRKLQEFVQALLEKEKISRFSVMAFSMGGKFALTVLEKFHPQMDELYLIAPDGIKTHLLYSLATYPGWLQGLFKRIVLRPTRFFQTLSWLEQKRWVNSGLVKFANWQMDSPQKRLRVYRSWTGFSNLTFDTRKMVRLLNQSNIEVNVFLGKYDQIISQKRLQVFLNALKRHHLVVLQTGHTNLLYTVAMWLRKHRAETAK
ncbi:alpha/beta hydrolase [Rufibacter psychrotolerans]|uniref:alpha/beta hydrolase n=1 Tax=Rufibacter psychrotolerans TaxID=2812556 RepID=UPI00293D7C88|nr:alpha/beta hydrolase [Rufibacter sp. SYSU D00308]